ncbi:hypothetical protein B0H13DRAFT_2307969 [Mycena leptocephala]|nr:hypothetical protein B0H13DRAFT_2307969 [Mycena leptocephala]
MAITRHRPVLSFTYPSYLRIPSWPKSTYDYLALFLGFAATYLAGSRHLVGIAKASLAARRRGGPERLASEKFHAARIGQSNSVGEERIQQRIQGGTDGVPRLNRVVSVRSTQSAPCSVWYYVPIIMHVSTTLAT